MLLQDKYDKLIFMDRPSVLPGFMMQLQSKAPKQKLPIARRSCFIADAEYPQSLACPLLLAEGPGTLRQMSMPTIMRVNKNAIFTIPCA